MKDEWGGNLKEGIELVHLFPWDSKNPNGNNFIHYKGELIYYEHRLAKEGERCLATREPKLYCNGIYAYSSKNPGDGIAFVIVDK